MKGLEPELHNMMEQHQQEIQELRRAHIKELQDTELRAMRKSNQQLEQLRIELTDTHEKMLAKEKEILAARYGNSAAYIDLNIISIKSMYISQLNRYKENLEEQDMHFQTQQKTFAEHFEREKSMLIAEQKKRDRETSVMIQQSELHFQVRVLQQNYSSAIDKEQTIV